MPSCGYLRQEYHYALLICLFCAFLGCYLSAQSIFISTSRSSIKFLLSVSPTMILWGILDFYMGCDLQLGMAYLIFGEDFLLLTSIIFL